MSDATSTRTPLQAARRVLVAAYEEISTRLEGLGLTSARCCAFDVRVRKDVEHNLRRPTKAGPLWA
jgi:hypothetical protein